MKLTFEWCTKKLKAPFIPLPTQTLYNSNAHNFKQALPLRIFITTTTIQDKILFGKCCKHSTYLSRVHIWPSDFGFFN